MCCVFGVLLCLHLCCVFDFVGAVAHGYQVTSAYGRRARLSRWQIGVCSYLCQYLNALVWLTGADALCVPHFSGHWEFYGTISACDCNERTATIYQLALAFCERSFSRSPTYTVDSTPPVKHRILNTDLNHVSSEIPMKTISAKCVV